MKIVHLCWGAEWGRPATVGVVTGRDWAVSRSAGVAGDAHGRWPIQCGAVGVEGWSVHRVVACAASPYGVPATVTQASLMAD